MKKRFLSLVLLGFLSLNIFVGCSKPNVPAPTADTDKVWTNDSNKTSAAEYTLEDYFTDPDNNEEFESSLYDLLNSSSDTYMDLGYSVNGNTLVYMYKYANYVNVDENTLKLALAETIESSKSSISLETGVNAADITLGYEYYDPDENLICSFRF